MNVIVYSLSSNGFFTGQITAVNNNYTVQVDNKTIVKLSLIDTNINESDIKSDATHFISVLCPIRSPVVVYPDLYSNMSSNQNSSNTEIYAKVFCLSSQNYNNNETIISINEQLLNSKLGSIDKELCKTSKFANLQWAIREGC